MSCWLCFGLGIFTASVMLAAILSLFACGAAGDGSDEGNRG